MPFFFFDAFIGDLPCKIVLVDYLEIYDKNCKFICYISMY